MRLTLFLCLLIIGCSSISYEEMEYQRMEGAKLYEGFKGDCNNKAWKLYPKNIALIDVKKSRNKKVKTGMKCREKVDLIGDLRGKQSVCKDTYNYVKEYYYVKEYQDINKNSRNKKYRSCLRTTCENYADSKPKLWNPRQVDDTKEKMKYCSGLAGKHRYERYSGKTYN